jgi:hypothetical protein
MRTAGIVLTAFASVQAAVGLPLIAVAAAQSGQPCVSGGCADIPNGFVAGISAGFLLGFSVVFAAVGVPLWVVGAQPPSATPAAMRLRPELAPSGLRWSF